MVATARKRLGPTSKDLEVTLSCMARWNDPATAGEKPDNGFRCVLAFQLPGTHYSHLIPEEGEMFNLGPSAVPARVSRVREGHTSVFVSLSVVGVPLPHLWGHLRALPGVTGLSAVLTPTWFEARTIS